MTLDDAIIELVAQVHSQEFKELSNIQWTKENRDELLGKAKELGEKVTTLSIQHIKNLDQNQIDGKSAFNWYISLANKKNHLDMLYSLRDNLDTVSEDQLKYSAFDYEWVNQHIRKAREDLSYMEGILNNVDPFKTEVEEL